MPYGYVTQVEFCPVGNVRWHAQDVVNGLNFLLELRLHSFVYRSA